MKLWKIQVTKKPPNRTPGDGDRLSPVLAPTIGALLATADSNCVQVLPAHVLREIVVAHAVPQHGGVDDRQVVCTDASVEFAGMCPTEFLASNCVYGSGRGPVRDHGGLPWHPPLVHPILATGTLQNGTNINQQPGA